MFSEISNLRATLNSTSIAELHVRFYVNLCRLSGYSPFSWDSEMNQVTVRKDKWKMKNNKVALALYFGVFIAMIYKLGLDCILKKPEDGKQNDSKQFLIGVIFLLIQVNGATYFSLVEYHGPAYAALLNEIIRKSRRQGIHKGIKIALNTLMISVAFMSVITFLVIAISQENLPLPASLILRTSLPKNNWMTRVLILSITLITLRSITCYWFMGITVFCGLFLSVGTLWESTRKLYNMVQKKKSKLSHQFTMYLRTQLLCCYTNLCFQKTIFFWLTIIISAIDVICLTTCLLASGTLAPGLIVIMMLLSLHVNIVSIFEYRLPGIMNQMSKDIIQAWKSNNQKGRRSWEAKFVRSCSELRIRFGEVNFFDTSTGLIVLNYKIQQIISFVLIGR
ncbi:unnamed protein product [Orchesella dallaii]|uniref:Gustatory receptor n=1 Tax=Orchesella dallaii TaxID=48710 RepID=A0ABP1PHW1_9HEXA